MPIRLIRCGLLTGAACTIAMAAAPAHAQNASTAAGADETVPEIVVAGIRRSLMDAVTVKRDSPAIVDAISAEDIGKFPDQNLAESLQRVTGVQIQRSNGEGTRISVRGLSPDFTRTQFNGRTITSTGQRSFDFSNLSSDFVSAIEVYKTPTADMIDGGLSATVNVRIARPLDVGKDRYAVAAEGIYEGNSKKVAPHLTAFVNKVFADGDVGVYVGADLRQRKYRTDSVVGFGAENGVEATRNPPVDYNRDGDFLDTFRFDHAAGPQYDTGKSRRITLVGGVQAKLGDEVELWGDVFYANLKDDLKRTSFYPRFTSIMGSVQNSTVSNGLVTELDADGVWMVANQEQNETVTNTVSPAVGLNWKHDNLTVALEGNYSRTRQERTNLGIEAIGRASVAYDLTADPGNMTSLAFTRGWDPMNPANYNVVGLRGSYKAPTTDKHKSFKGDVSYRFDDGFINQVSAGVNFSDRRLSFDSARVTMSAQTLAGLLGVPYNAGVEGGSFVATPVMSRFSFPNAFPSYSGPANLLTTGLYTDLDLLYAQVPFSQVLAAASPQADPAADYKVDEKSFGAYVRLDFATADDRLSGNAGIRYVKTRQASIGSVPDFNDITFIQLAAQTLVGTAPSSMVKNNYSNWLPSFNLRYKLTDQLSLRFGAARVMTRPTLSLLTTSTSINANVRNISSGNPRLKPFLASQADLSLEYYFGQTGLLSAAVFYKDVKNFVVNATQFETYAVKQGVGGPLQNVTFSHSFPDNGASTKLKGIELSAQVPFTFLPSPFDGFGALANVTLLDVGSVVPASGAAATPLPGVSKKAYNAALYYEKYGFGARISYTYRSKYTNDQVSYFGDGDFQRSFGQVDGSLSYDVNSNISLNLDVANLLNEPSVNYDNLNIVRYYEDSGRRITLGARVRF